ncbi:DUF433 domain-containing protein [Candidatus Brocadia sapporoensis]
MVSNPKVMTGKLVVAGTRITIELILEKFAAKVLRADVVCPIRVIVS